MVVPVGPAFAQALCVVDKGLDGKVSVQRNMGVRFVPLTEKRSQLGEN